MAERKRIEKLVSETNEHDVVTGRGRGTNDRPGNVYFRQLALERSRDFEASTSVARNSEMARELVGQIETKGGRFLRPVTATNAEGKIVSAWELLSDEAKFTKAKQAMRDSSSSRRNRAQQDDRKPQARQHHEDQHMPGHRSIEGQTSGQPRRDDYLPTLSNLELLARQQQRNFLDRSSSNLYSMFLPQDASHAASLLHLPSSVPTTHSHDTMLPQGPTFADQRYFQLQQELARQQELTRQRQRRHQQDLLVQYHQQRIRALSSSQLTDTTAQLANPFSQYVQADSMGSAIASPNLRQQSSYQPTRITSAVLSNPFTVAAVARKRSVQETNSESDDEGEEGRKPKAIRVIPPSQRTTSNVSQILPSAAIQPFDAAGGPLSFLDTSPVAGQNLLPLIDQAEQQEGRRNVATLNEKIAEDKKSCGSPGSQTTPSASSSRAAYG